MLQISLTKLWQFQNIKTYKIPYQVRRRFDLTTNMPEGLLVVGDAHCRFDPVFGQGVSVAAMEARQLQLLRKVENNLIKHLHNNFIKRQLL